MKKCDKKKEQTTGHMSAVSKGEIGQERERGRAADINQSIGWNGGKEGEKMLEIEVGGREREGLRKVGERVKADVWSLVTEEDNYWPLRLLWVDTN